MCLKLVIGAINHGQREVDRVREWPRGIGHRKQPVNIGTVDILWCALRVMTIVEGRYIVVVIVIDVDHTTCDIDNG